MESYKKSTALLVLLMLTLFVTPLTTYAKKSSKPFNTDKLFSANIEPPGEKVIIVDPTVHAWAAYLPNGQLVRTGMATAGSNWCRDLGRPCRTKTGSFRIYSLGDSSCKSTKFPLPYGGAPMPYCMFFNGGQALHGSHEVVRANASHGCVRLKVHDAEWLRYDFVEGPNATNGFKGTKVIIKPY